MKTVPLTCYNSPLLPGAVIESGWPRKGTHQVASKHKPWFHYRCAFATIPLAFGFMVYTVAILCILNSNSICLSSSSAIMQSSAVCVMSSSSQSGHWAGCHAHNGWTDFWKRWVSKAPNSVLLAPLWNLKRGLKLGGGLKSWFEVIKNCLAFLSPWRIILFQGM